MKQRKKYNMLLFFAIGVLVVLLGLSFVALIQANQQMEKALKSGNMDLEEYGKHYALIVANPGDESSQGILRGCQTEGKLKNVYVELFGADLSEEYSVIDLIHMAIESNVDGIILEAEETESYKEMIQLAWEKGIPTVTVESDCMESARISYVGIGAYDLGREYARQIIKAASMADHMVVVLMDTETDDSTQNIICNGIRETLNNEGNHLSMDLEIKAVDSTSYFAADESIRNILTDMEELPDYVVCMNEQDTMIMYNALVNYNIVGKVKVLGYYTSETILSAIEKKIITSTIAIDYEKMGISCVDALDEYYVTGNVNGYFLMDVNTVNASNVKEYLNHESN